MSATAKWFPPEEIDTTDSVGTITTVWDVSGCDILLINLENVTGSRGVAVLSLQGSTDNENWTDIASSIVKEGRQLPVDISNWAWVRFRIETKNVGAWTILISVCATNEDSGVTVTTIDLNDDVGANSYALKLFDCQGYNTLRVRGDAEKEFPWSNAVVTFYWSTDGIEWTSLSKTLSAAGDVVEIDVQNIRFVVAKTTTAESGASIGVLTAFASTDVIVSEVPSTPIGSIVAWAKTLSGVPAIPTGWVECDGATLSDPDSPLDGVTMPDLQGGEFLRGNSSSGGTGGAATVTLTGGESGTSAHVHAAATNSYVTAPAGANDVSGFGGVGAIGLATNTAASAEANADDAHENLPPYYDVVWIIRVK